MKEYLTIYVDKNTLREEKYKLAEKYMIFIGETECYVPAENKLFMKKKIGKKQKNVYPREFTGFFLIKKKKRQRGIIMLKIVLFGYECSREISCGPNLK